MAHKLLTDKEIAVIAAVEAKAKSVSDGASELGINERTLRRWRDRPQVKERVRQYLNRDPPESIDDAEDPDLDPGRLQSMLLDRIAEARDLRKKLGTAREVIASQALEMQQLRTEVEDLRERLAESRTARAADGRGRGQGKVSGGGDVAVVAEGENKAQRTGE